MYIRIVTFTLAGSEQDYRQHAPEIAPAFLDWPGLLAKVWLADPVTHTYGGVYLFTSRDAADCSRDTEIFRRMQANRDFTDLRVREFDCLDDATAVTAAPLVPTGN